MSDDQIHKLCAAAMIDEVYSAYKAAVEHKERRRHPGENVKGYGLGEAGEGRNITHQQRSSTNGAARVSHTLRYSLPDGRSRRDALLPSSAGQPETQYY